MGVKYRNIFTNTSGESIKTDIIITGYAGAVIPINTVNESPVSLAREAADNGKLYGVFGSSLRVSLFNEGNVTVTDFLVNDFSECQVNLYIDEILEFTGFIVMDDITTELRSNPIQLQLTFSDNLALLSDKSPAFTIDNEFTLLITIVRELLALTGLSLPLNVFHRPYPNTESYEAGSFESVKILERTFAESLQAFENGKDILNKLCEALRCRVYQSKGEWYMVRVHDYLYGATLQGWNYDGSNVGTPITYDATPIADLVMIQFSQNVTYKRAVSSVTNTYNFDSGFQLFNADLQELGSLVSTTIVDDTTVKRYNIPSYWVLDGGMTAFIEVVTDTALDEELDRYLLLPYLNVAQFNTPDGLRFNSIMASKGDRFNFKCTSTATADSNLAAKFLMGVILVGTSGTTYNLAFDNSLLLEYVNMSWQASAFTPATMVTDQWTKEIPGRFDNTDAESFGIRSDIKALPIIPEDGFIHVKLGAYKNNDSRQADLNAQIRDLSVEYEFLINKAFDIVSQKHATQTSAQTLNAISNELFVDQSIKFSAIGNLYDTDDNKISGWLWPDGGGYSIAIGQLNNTEEGIITGESRRVISGIFLGGFDFQDLWGFDGSSWVPVRLITDYRYGRVEAEFLEIVEQLNGTYNFSYVYKVKD